MLTLAQSLQRLRTQSAPVIARGPVEVTNLATVTAESPDLGDLPAPDEHRGYISFDICNTIGGGPSPRMLGPVQAMNHIGFLPEILCASADSMLYQQFNVGHLLTCYSGKQGTPDFIPNDRIIGCIVSVSHAARPNGGFKQTDETCLRCVAVVFKIAKGVSKLLGEHLTGKVRQSVSMECTTPVMNLGVWRHSTKEMYPLLDPPEAWKAAYKANEVGLPTIGKFMGEQLVIVYGTEKPVLFRGVGITPRPAEKAAKITGVNCSLALAESVARAAEDGTMVGVMAKSMNAAFVGQAVQFKVSGAVGVIEAAYSQGRPALSSWPQGVDATEEDPALLIRVGSDYVLHKASMLKKIALS